MREKWDTLGHLIDIICPVREKWDALGPHINIYCPVREKWDTSSAPCILPCEGKVGQPIHSLYIALWGKNGTPQSNPPIYFPVREKWDAFPPPMSWFLICPVREKWDTLNSLGDLPCEGKVGHPFNPQCHGSYLSLWGKSGTSHPPLYCPVSEKWDALPLPGDLPCEGKVGHPKTPGRFTLWGKNGTAHPLPGDLPCEGKVGHPRSLIDIFYPVREKWDSPSTPFILPC